MLHHRHLVAIMLEDVGNPLPAGTICESSMHKNHILNMLTHDYSPLDNDPAGSVDVRD
jgi:hypothetical protein